MVNNNLKTIVDREHLAGSHKDNLKAAQNTYSPAKIENILLNGILVTNNSLLVRNQFDLNPREGALLEKYDPETALYQPVGHIAPPFFRVFSNIEYPDERDVRLTPKLKFGLKPSSYNYFESTVGLELEMVFYNQKMRLVSRPKMKKTAFFMPTTEFFHQLGELGTDPCRGGVYTHPAQGLMIHRAINHYLVQLAKKTGKLAHLSGTISCGIIRGKDVSIENEYLRRISIWLTQRANKKCFAISHKKLRKMIKNYFIKNKMRNEMDYHNFTALYDVLTFQPMIAIPNHDGDFCIKAINFLNGPIMFALMAIMANSPFWQDKETGYQYFRGELRHIFLTGLRIPRIPLWFEGTRERVIRHLRSGEGINLGRAILSDDKICYSNSLFRIRPDIGGIEIAGLDSHPLPELRVAVAEVIKMLFHYLNEELVAGKEEEIFSWVLAGPASRDDYYWSYTQVCRYGVLAKIRSKGRCFSVKEILEAVFDRLKKHNKKYNLFSLEEFKFLIERPIITIFDFLNPKKKISAKKIYSRSCFQHIAFPLALIKQQKVKDGKSVEEVEREFLFDFIDFYS